MQPLRKLVLAGLVALAIGGQAEAAVSTSQRRLVIVSTLETFGQAKYAWLYDFIDAYTISMGQGTLSGSYQSISVLPQDRAERAKFVSLLRSLSNNSSVKAIDVILSVHGAKEKMWFDDGAVSTAQLQSELMTLPNRAKFRLLYSLACYGATHMDEWLKSGFRTAIGARKVNTASASEYPAFLAAWKLGQAVNPIFAATNADPAMLASDQVAIGMGFSDPDSFKLVGGTQSLNIYSNAQ